MVTTPSTRELKKADKRERIRLAALALFSELGYEATTMRDVARKAGVALGTLSLYAQDKRDLSLLVFNDRIGDLTTQAIAAAWRDRNADLLTRLMAFFSAYYSDFDRNHTLARVFLQLNYYSSGMHGPAYHAMTLRVFGAVEAMVNEARGSGEIARDGEDSDLVARHFFFVFSSSVRWWIAAEKPSLMQGLDELSRLLAIQIAGLKQPLSGPARKAGMANRRRNARD